MLTNMAVNLQLVMFLRCIWLTSDESRETNKSKVGLLLSMMALSYCSVSYLTCLTILAFLQELLKWFHKYALSLKCIEHLGRLYHRVNIIYTYHRNLSCLFRARLLPNISSLGFAYSYYRYYRYYRYCFY